MKTTNSKTEYKTLLPENTITPTQQRIISLLTKQGSLTRRELVKQLTTPRTTIYDNLVKLKKRKIVEKFSRNSGFRGHPLVYWKLIQ